MGSCFIGGGSMKRIDRIYEYIQQESRKYAREQLKGHVGA